MFAKPQLPASDPEVKGEVAERGVRGEEGTAVIFFWQPSTGTPLFLFPPLQPSPSLVPGPQNPRTSSRGRFCAVGCRI